LEWKAAPARLLRAAKSRLERPAQAPAEAAAACSPPSRLSAPPPAALAKVITDHIAETTAAFRGRLVDWDVINETFTNHDFMDILGRHAMVDWFRAACAGDPGAKLYVNDFNILRLDAPQDY